MAEFTASDGARIAYRDVGQGTPIVLLHGLMAHGGFFDKQAPLADRFRLISIDLRGHGESRAAASGAAPTVERIAEDVAELAEALDLESAIGVGWSLGATVLWHVLDGPAGARFVGAVVIDMTARVLNDADWALGLSIEACEARSAAIRDDFDSFARAAGEAIFAQPVAAKHRRLADWAANEFAASDAAAMGAVWASLVRLDARPLLAGIRHPTLVVESPRRRAASRSMRPHLKARRMPPDAPGGPIRELADRDR